MGCHMRSRLPFFDSSFDSDEREDPKKPWMASDSSSECLKHSKCNNGNVDADSQSESELTEDRLSRKRKKLRRVAAICDDDPLIVAESDKEQENGALILMMLSRDEFSVKLESELKKSSMRKSCYQCRTCNKVFDSYQALGGHRASHNANVAKRSKKRSSDHECPVCGKAFASGQALGGHKRSHLAVNSQANSGGLRFRGFNDEDFGDAIWDSGPSHCL